jgi:hypothetical protein
MNRRKLIAATGIVSAGLFWSMPRRIGPGSTKYSSKFWVAGQFEF